MPKKKKASDAAPKAPAPAPAPFKAVKSWPDCLGRKVLIWHPALGLGPEANGYHKAKVINVDLNLGSVLVAVALGKEKRGHYLLPIDSAAARVK